MTSPTTLFLEPPLDSKSTSFFMDQFVVAPETGQNVGWFEFLPELLSHAEPSSALDIAFRGCSYLALANRQDHETLRYAALNLYGQALRSTNEELKSPETATSDTTFAAILLLCLFGHINGDLRMQIGAHALGMYKLLELRARTGVHSAHTLSLTRHFFALMHLENNKKLLASPAAAGGGGEAVSGEASQAAASDLFARMGMLWPISAALLTQMHMWMNSDDSTKDISALLPLLENVRKLEKQVQLAIQGLDPIWYYTTIPAREANPKSKWNETFRKALVYHDSWIMSMWHAYRVTRISLHTTMVASYDMILDTGDSDMINLFDEELEELKTQSLSIIDTMNEDICTSIPWILGQVEEGGGQNPSASLPKASRASLSIVGLKTVVNGRYTRQHHSDQARNALWDIAYRFGIKGAL
ncbi:hypothetical protein, variant 2 [Exophiala oligosperma]|nr:hypothetical protein, variant 1 [Exophiala oligosperma]XP_016266962.1 hypothetical protein, variant 2 [Exophiala oligosperma]KIW46745.1 hypothetical protein, variant 1 [Exophiala oligosperma]KIW46746.1 hypothetical protein, variant 2 [Exophiala oligosperma]